MNWLDLAILLTILWFVIAGATAGLVREMVGLVALIGGIVIAGLVYRNLAADIDVMVSSQRTARVVSFAAVLFAVLLAGQIISVLLRGAVSTLALGPFDHAGGLVVGLVKGVMIVEVVLFVFARYPTVTMRNAIDGSLIAPLFLDGIPFVLSLLPSDFRTAVQRFPAPLESAP